MRFQIPWVSATTFGFVGFFLALIMAVMTLGMQFVIWSLLPSTVTSAVAVYGVSTWLGRLAMRASPGFLVSELVGVLIAFATLIAGIAAFGLGNILLVWLDQVHSGHFAWMDANVFFSESIRAYVLQPIWAVLIYGGGVIALIFGMVYGRVLFSTGEK